MRLNHNTKLSSKIRKFATLERLETIFQELGLVNFERTPRLGLVIYFCCQADKKSVCWFKPDCQCFIAQLQLKNLNVLSIVTSLSGSRSLINLKFKSSIIEYCFFFGNRIFSVWFRYIPVTRQRLGGSRSPVKISSPLADLDYFACFFILLLAITTLLKTATW